MCLRFWTLEEGVAERHGKFYKLCNTHTRGHSVQNCGKFKWRNEILNLPRRKSNLLRNDRWSQKRPNILAEVFALKSSHAMITVWRKKTRKTRWCVRYLHYCPNGVCIFTDQLYKLFVLISRLHTSVGNSLNAVSHSNVFRRNRVNHIQS